MAKDKNRKKKLIQLVRKRNPQDTTLRNTQSTNKKLSKLAADIKKLNEENERRKLADRRNNAKKLGDIAKVIEQSGADSASQKRALSQIKEVLGW